ncbi:hypothetical protein D046_8917, partial [Vibrio parahaemolyticus V-223/04]
RQMNNFSFDATIDFVVISLENITILDKKEIASCH